MASISKNGAKGHHKFTLNVVEKDISIPNNTSSVDFSFVLSPVGNGWDWYGWTNNISYVVTINGTKFTGTIPEYDGSSTVTLKTGTVANIEHTADGTKSISISFSVTDGANQYYTCGNASESGTMALSTIPRYAKITTFNVNKRDETSLTVNWDCDASCDKIYYAINSGGWVEADGYPNFAITGLKANTTYSIKIRVRRKDSQLLTDSTAKSQTTYNYPHCNATPDFTIGDPVTLSFYNPLKRTCKFYVIANGTQLPIEYEVSGTSYTGICAPNSSVIELYKTIPNAQIAKYKIKVVYGSSTITYDNGNTYKVKGTEIPTVNGISFKDIDNKVVAITGDDQQIVQNQSTLQITYSQATPNNYAGGISKYSFVLNGVTKESTSAGGTVNFGKVNSANDLTLTLTVTDSRGLKASRDFNIPMVAHSNPTATVNLERLNNYEDETYLTVEASISSVNEKNTMVIEYRYKLFTDEYSPFVEIPNRQTQTLYLNKNSIFVFNVVVTDAFGTTFDREYILYKGVFPLFIDTGKNAVSINEFPTEGEALRVAGGLSHFEDGVKINGEAVGDFIVEQGTSGVWTYRKWHSGNVDMECVISNASSVSNELIEVSVNLPFAVSKIKPYVTCLAGGWALTKPPYFNVYGGNNSADNCTELLMYYTAENATSRSYYFAIEVKGTWR